MADKIFGTDFDNITDATGAETISVNNGSALKDIRLDNMVGAVVHNSTAKTSLVSADLIAIWDSVSSVIKNITYTNLLSSLKTYFDTLYTTINTTTPYNGWIPVSATWTRTGNHTFTVSGDVTTTYRKGTKVRYKDGGSYEYGMIASSVYGAPNTTVTLITNSDYAMAAATITDTYLSYAETPEGFPAYFNYTTTPTNFTVGNGVLVTRWTAALGRMHIHLEFVLGSTSSVGSTPSFSLPVASSGYSSQFFTSVGVGMYFDNAGASYAGQIALNGSGDVSSAYLVALITSSSYATQTDLSATKPFTWGTSDIMQAELTYQW